MNGVALLTAMLVLGVDYGYQPTEDGRLEYIIQIDPVVLDILRQEGVVLSELPDDVVDVRRVRIQIGNADLPRIPLPPADDPSPVPASEGDTAPTVEITEAVPDHREPGLEASERLPTGPSTDEANDQRGLDEPHYDEPPEDEQPDVFPEESGTAEPPDAGAVADSAPAWWRNYDGHDDEPQQWAAPPEPTFSKTGGRLIDDRSDGTLRPLVTPDSNVSQAGYEQQADDPPLAEAPSPSDLPPESPQSRAPLPIEPQPPGKPWTAFTLTALALFASLGGNVYLGWIAWGLHGRCRRLLDQARRRRAS